MKDEFSRRVIDAILSRQMPDNIRGYRPDIDGLRAIAVLLVLGYHAFPAQVPGGFVGVDVFFVISGYLISSVIFEGLRRGSFTFIDFYGRRVRRIFPALITVLAAVCAFGWFALLPDELKMLGKDVRDGAAFISNFALWQQSGYFDVAAELKPLLHLWSLGVEEQFYLMWPLLLWVSVRRGWRLKLTTWTVLAVSFALNVYFVGSKPVMTFYFPFTRLWELMAGALIARHDLNRTEPSTNSPRASKELLAASGVALILGSAMALDRRTPFPGWSATLPVIGTCLLVSSKQRSSWMNGRVLRLPIIVGIGLISYPLYLWHWPLLTFARIIESRPPANAVKAVLLGCAFLLAWLTYSLIEQPIKKRATSSQSLALLVPPLCVVALTGSVMFRSGGFPGRFPPVQEVSVRPLPKTKAITGPNVTRTAVQGRAPDAAASVEAAPKITRATPSPTQSAEATPVVSQSREGARPDRAAPGVATPVPSIPEVTTVVPGAPEVAEAPIEVVRDPEEFKEVQFPNIEECQQRYGFAKGSYCGLSDLNREPTVMVLGDSHSRAYFTGLTEYFDSHREAFVSFGIGGCPPFLGIVRPFGDNIINCNAVISNAMDFLDSHHGVRTVILSAAFNTYTNVLVDADPSQKTTGPQAFVKGLDAVIGRIESAGRRVIFLDQVPMIDFDPKVCRPRPFRSWSAESCKMPRDFSRAKDAEYRGLVKQVLEHHPRVKEVDPSDAFCDASFCYAEREGHVLYFDTNHINRFGSALFGRQALAAKWFE